MQPRDENLHPRSVSGEQAVVSLPAEESSADLTGQDGATVAPYPDTSPFWQTPPEKGTYTDAPYSALELQLLERQVQTACEYLSSRGYEAERHELLYRLYTHVLPAMREYEQLRHELEPQRAELERYITQLRGELRQTEEKFFQRLSEARLPLPVPESEKKKRKKAPPEPLLASPELAERALRDAFARSAEICGEQGIAHPYSYKQDLFTKLTPVGTFLMEFFAPLTAGVLLGINIGVITGFLKLDDLLNLRNLMVVAFAAGVGFIVEKLGGHIYYNLANSYAQALEKREIETAKQPVPSLKRWFPVAILSPLALLIGVSMVMVDALGLQMLHEEALRKLQLEGVETGSQLFPFWVYLAVGAIVSLPYLVYKAVRGWREAEIRQREAYIEYLTWQHIEERRKEPAVQEAFVLGNRAVGLRTEIEAVQAKLAEIRTRLDAARTQAIGLHRQFQDYFQSLLEGIRGEQPSQLGFASVSGRYGQESFWQRFKRWLFGR